MPIGRTTRGTLTAVLSVVVAATAFAVQGVVASAGSTAFRIGFAFLGAGIVWAGSALPALPATSHVGSWRTLWSRGTRCEVLRIVLYAACGGLVACTIVPLPSESDEAADARTMLFRGGTCLGFGLALYALSGRAAVGGTAVRSGFARVADVAAWNVLATLVVAEAVLLVMLKVSPSPWLYDDQSAERYVDAHRLDPRATDLRNSGGFHDEEFFVAGPGDEVVALVGDSFGMGVVPWEFTFATVAERRLRDRLAAQYDRVAVHNVSVGACGIREYLYLLQREALPLRPNRVVLSIYVGNDLFVEDRPPPEGPLHRYRRLQDWTVGVAAARIAATFRHVERIDHTLRSRDPNVPPSFAEEMRASQSHPTLTESAYREGVQARSRIARPDDEGMARSYNLFFRDLETFAELAGPDLLVIVAPDEFQVNEAVYAELVQSLGDRAAALDRDLPQRRIREWCAARGLACLDVLPLLRAAEAIRPTYVPRDTHWNAWGNIVVGRALATALLDGVDAVRTEDCLAEP